MKQTFQALGGRISWSICAITRLNAPAGDSVFDHISRAADAFAQDFVESPKLGQAANMVALDGGNVTKEGITKDLEWMNRVGIGGFQLADVGSRVGQTVEKDEFMTPAMV